MKIEHNIIKALVVFLILSLPLTLQAVQIVRIDRGIHNNFELIVFHSDSTGEFYLDYDRVAGEVTIEVSGGTLSRVVADSIYRWKPGNIVKSARADITRGQIVIKAVGQLYLREYYVGGPPALILDISKAPDSVESLPFELDREGYLYKGGIAEREGRLDDALAYINMVQSIGPDDLTLTHRAGIIAHRMGRWDSALETFSRTADMSELAADAHARRTVIYFVMGNSDAAAREWAGYFHRVQPNPLPAALAASNPTTPTNIPTSNSQIGTEKTSREPILIRFSPKPLDLEEDNYLYLGWVLLIVGAAVLIFAFKMSGPRSEGAFPIVTSSNGVDINLVETKSSEQPKTESVGKTKMRFVRGPDGWLYRKTDRPGYKEDTQKEKDTPKVVAYRRAGDRLPDGSIVQPSQSKRIPVERIIELKNAGEEEWEIARRLGFSRDEVTMAINLARMARNRRSTPQNKSDNE